MTIILGADGRPLDLKAMLPRLERPQTAELGAIVTEFDRHPSSGLTPAKLSSILKQAEQGDLVGQAELADDMEERDAHLYAELSKRRGAITALDRSIEPPDKATPAEEALTERVRDWLDMITVSANGVTGGMDVLLGAMTAAVLPGYAPIEKVWNLTTDSGGKPVRIPHFTLQPQRWFTTSPDRRRFLLRSNSKMVPGEQLAGGALLPPKMGVELEPFAWLMHVHPARCGFIARMSLARVLFWPYLFKNYAVRDLAEFLEIYGLPLRLGKYPSGASDDEKATLLEAVTMIGHNAAGIVPQGMALEFQAAAAGTEVPFAAMWDRMDAAESKAILGQTLSASEGSKGSHALGQVHEEVRMGIRNADARLYESSFNQQVIAQLVALNAPGANMRRLPRLVLDTGEAEDLAAYADNLPKLAKAGLRIKKKWVHEKLRIPEADPDDEVLEVAEPPPADMVDELVAEQTAQWQPLLAPLIEPLMAELDKAVAAGESLDAFAARVPELVRLMDTQAFTEDLAQAAFSARLAGEADLDLEAGS